LKVALLWQRAFLEVQARCWVAPALPVFAGQARSNSDRGGLS
jgi:hypothetical protein